MPFLKYLKRNSAKRKRIEKSRSGEKVKKEVYTEGRREKGGG